MTTIRECDKYDFVDQKICELGDDMSLQTWHIYREVCVELMNFFSPEEAWALLELIRKAIKEDFT